MNASFRVTFLNQILITKMFKWNCLRNRYDSKKSMFEFQPLMLFFWKPISNSWQIFRIFDTPLLIDRGKKEAYTPLRWPFFKKDTKKHFVCESKTSKKWTNDSYGSLIKIEKNFFFNFCYLIRVEHKKCSELSVRIIRFWS